MKVGARRERKTERSVLDCILMGVGGVVQVHKNGTQWAIGMHGVRWSSVE